jgi:type I restriction enzyme M protein
MFEQAFNNIDDVLWKNVSRTNNPDNTKQTSRPLFFKCPDTLEDNEMIKTELREKTYSQIIEKPHQKKSWVDMPSCMDASNHKGCIFLRWHS